MIKGGLGANQRLIDVGEVDFLLFALFVTLSQFASTKCSTQLN